MNNWLKLLLFVYISITLIDVDFATASSNKYKKEYDLSKNGKIDQIKYFENRKLVRVELDRNGDGNFDSFTTYKKGDPFKINELDNNVNSRLAHV